MCVFTNTLSRLHLSKQVLTRFCPINLQLLLYIISIVSLSYNSPVVMKYICTQLRERLRSLDMPIGLKLTSGVKGRCRLKQRCKSPNALSVFCTRTIRNSQSAVLSYVPLVHNLRKLSSTASCQNEHVFNLDPLTLSIHNHMSINKCKRVCVFRVDLCNLDFVLSEIENNCGCYNSQRVSFPIVSARNACWCTHLRGCNRPSHW